MTRRAATIRVLYSFPQKLGAGRVCYTAWQQVKGLHEAGAEVTVLAGAVARPVPRGVRLRTTLGRGRFRLPYRAVGMRRACALHDYVVARSLPALADQIDVIHAWPLGARRTLAVARELGIPTFLERPNAHTRFAYEAVAAESRRIGMRLPRGAEHAFDGRVLKVEEEEYALTDHLLCPSAFVRRTFLDQGVPADKLVSHTYGFDHERFWPVPERDPERPFTAVFVGYAAVRKGLHIALDAWLATPGSSAGRFLVAGEVMPEYAEVLRDRLAHPSVHLLGHRDDVPELMRNADVMVLPSVEEGFGLVCVEAMGSGCVPLVSDACTDVCRDGENAQVHHVGDVQALTAHLTLLQEDSRELERLRGNALATAPGLTWSAAGRRLLEAYEESTRRTVT